MTKKAYVVLMSVLAVALAVPLMAQSVRLAANIPFAFTVSGKTLPAGEYMITNGPNFLALYIRGEQNNDDAVVLINHKYVGRTYDPSTLTRLEFNKYGNRYFLSEVLDGYVQAGFVVPMTKSEREMAKTASAGHTEVLATLAKR